jgi:hypothetical protein
MFREAFFDLAHLNVGLNSKIQTVQYCCTDRTNERVYRDLNEGLKEQNTNVMFARHFLALLISIRLKTANTILMFWEAFLDLAHWH